MRIHVSSVAHSLVLMSSDSLGPHSYVLAGTNLVAHISVGARFNLNTQPCALVKIIIASLPPTYSDLADAFEK